MLVFGGLPLFYMELCLGQFHRLFSHPETTATKNVIIWKEYREQSCFYQVWLPFSLEEDLSSFKRGETSNLISQETDIQISREYVHSENKGWLCHLCDRHLHGDVLQHHHWLGCLLLRRKVTPAQYEVGKLKLKTKLIKFKSL